MPEVDFGKVRVRKNDHAARIAREGITVQVGRRLSWLLRRSARHGLFIQVTDRWCAHGSRVGPRMAEGATTKRPLQDNYNVRILYG